MEELKKYYVYYAEDFPGRVGINRLTVEAASDAIAKRLASEYVYEARGKEIYDVTLDAPEFMDDGRIILNGTEYTNAEVLISNVSRMFFVEWHDGRLMKVVSKKIKAFDIGEAMLKTAYNNSFAENRVIRAFPV